MNNIECLENLKNMTFSLIKITEQNCFTDWKMKHTHFNKYMIIFITKGSGSLYMNKKHYPLETNACFMLVPGLDISLETNPYDPLRFFEISFLYEVKHDVHNKKLDFPLKGQIPIENSLEVFKLIKELYETEHKLNFLEELRKNALFVQILYILADNIYRESISMNMKSAIQISKEYMDKHYDQDLTRETIAKVVGISTDYFSHLFKKEVGISPNEYLTQIRIRHAKENLITSNQRLKGIAKSVGYSDEFYFSRVFKKVVGVSPTVYVKNNKKKIVTLSDAFCSDMVALGVKPYASLADIDGRHNPYVSPYLSETICTNESETILGHSKIQADLFICPDKMSVDVDNLKQIAPTVKIPWLDCDWREHFRQIAKIIKKEKEAELWLKKYKQKSEDASEKLRNIRDETIIILRIYNGECFIYGDRNIGAVIYQDLKLVPPIDLLTINQSKKITISELPTYDADHILLMVDNEEKSQRKFNSLIKSEQWKSLKGVQNSKIYFLDKSLWLEYSALSHERIIDEAVSMFNK